MTVINTLSYYALVFSIPQQEIGLDFRVKVGNTHDCYLGLGHDAQNWEWKHKRRKEIKE